MTDDGLYIRRTLEKKLRAIWDNDDFIIGAVSNAATVENWGILCDFIDMAGRLGDTLIPDDLTMLSLILGEKSEKEENKDFQATGKSGGAQDDGKG